MRRLCVSILLLLGMLALTSGAAAYAHDVQHLHDHAPAHADEPAGGSHDEASCLLHALLNAPLLGTGWIALLVCLGLFVAFLTMLAPQAAAQRVLFDLPDCRGPPLLLAHR